jgi:holin-like protein
MKARAKDLGLLLVGVAILVAIWAGADATARALDLPVPGNVLGMLALFALLAAGVVPRTWVERGADLLLKHLSLFFVPPAVAVLRHRGLLAQAPLAVAIVIVPVTFVVLLVSGRVAERLVRREKKGSP